MASMFGTVAFAIIRLAIIKGKHDTWLAPTKFENKTTRVVLAMWLFSLTFSLPPLLGYGRFSKEMVGVK